MSKKDNAIENREITTINLATATKRRLDGRKRHPRESYDEVVARLLDVLDQNAPAVSGSARAGGNA